MRRIFFICALVALVLPAAAAGRRSAPGDGTLTVKDANAALIQMQVRGAGIIGRCDQCSLRVTDPNPDDRFEEVITGAEHTRPVNDKVTVYSGTQIKYRYIGGRFKISISGFGINFALVGRGPVSLLGKGTGDDGTYSVNGGDPLPLPSAPSLAATVVLGAGPPAGP